MIFFKKNKNKIITAVCIISLLTIAFFFDGNKPVDTNSNAGAVSVVSNSSSDSSKTIAAPESAESAQSQTDIHKTSKNATPTPDIPDTSVNTYKSADISETVKNHIPAYDITDTPISSQESQPSVSAENGNIDSVSVPSNASTVQKDADSAYAHHTHQSQTEVSKKADAATSFPTKTDTPVSSQKSKTGVPSTISKTTDKKVIDAQEENNSTKTIEQKEFSATTPTPTPQKNQKTTAKNPELTCTLSIRCDNAIGQSVEKADIIPEDGIILKEQTVVFYEGESVFNVILRETKENKIHLEYVNTPVYNSTYIEGIGNLYEFDCGDLSGWMYKVNGYFPDYACSQHILKQGDKIEFVYTCNLGKDVQ